MRVFVKTLADGLSGGRKAPADRQLVPGTECWLLRRAADRRASWSDVYSKPASLMGRGVGEGKENTVTPLELKDFYYFLFQRKGSLDSL